MVLTGRTIFCYGFFQFCLTAIYTNVPTGRTYVYKDTLKLPLGTISWIMAAVKAIDILTGFVVGKISDNTRTSYGRRKPFLIIAWPIGLVVILMLVAGAQIFPNSPHKAPCQHLTPNATRNETCNAIRLCYDTAIASGELLPPDSPYIFPGNATSNERVDASIESYFFIIYFLYFTFIVSGSQIPYDALGQELSDSVHSVRRLAS